MTLTRRGFVAAAAPLALLRAQDPPPSWPSPVLDIHFHPKANPEANVKHLDGCGVKRAVLLTRLSAEADAQAAMKAYPDRFVRFTSMDAAKADLEALRKSVKGGALGLGELKSHVACDGPEMKRIYALAAELSVPVLIHFGDHEQFPGEGTWNTGIERLPKVLAEFKKTTFIGHGDAFWAHVSADGTKGVPYPTGPIKRGGLSDRMLADYPNMWGDLSANSGRNALARDLDFSADFLSRHRNKLMFGSDCSCSDGRGAGQRSTQPLVSNRCVARETLTALKQLTKPELFKQIAWTNGTKLLKLPA